MADLSKTLRLIRAALDQVQDAVDNMDDPVEIENLGSEHRKALDELENAVAPPPAQPPPVP